MRKLISIIMLSAMLLMYMATCVQAEGEGIFVDFNNGRPANWLTYNTASAAVADNSADGSKALSLSVDTGTNYINFPSARAASSEIKPGSNTKVFLSFRFSRDDGVVPLGRYLRLLWGDITDISGNISTSANLINIKDSITIDSNSVALENKKEYIVSILLDLTNKTQDVWVDNTKIVTAKSFTASTSFSASTLRLMFVNAFSQQTGKSTLNIYDVMATTSSVASIVSTPQNGGQFIDVAGLNSIKLNMGTVLLTQPSVTLEVSDLGANHFTPLDKTVKFYKSNMEIIPSAPLNVLKEYRVTLSGMQNLMGTALSDSSISFSTAPAGYVPPTVQITSPIAGSEFRPNQSVQLRAAASSANGISDVKYYVGGQFIGASNASPYAFNWTTPNTDSSYTIKAVVTDSLGGNSSAEIDVTIKTNQLPVVDIQNISNGIIDKSILNQIMVTASDDKAIIKVELYFDGVLKDTKTSAPYTFGITDATLGSHSITVKAYDDEGGTTQITRDVKITGQADIVRTDFTNYAGTAFTGTTQSVNGGYLKGEVLDPAKGTSAVFGGEATTGGGPYIGAVYKTDWERLSFKCDVYFSRNDFTGGINTRGKTAGSAGGEGHMNNTLFTADGKVRLMNGTAIGAEWAYSPNTWYTLEYIPNFKTKTYDFYWNGEKKATNFAFSIADYLRLEDNIRLSANFVSGKPGFVAMDNLSLTKPLPYITKIADAGGSDDPLNYTSPVIKVTTSDELGSISASDTVNLNPEDFELSNEIEKVNILSVTKDTDPKTIIITPEKVMESSNTYTLTIKATAKLVDRSTKLGVDTIEHFQTSSKPLDVVSGAFSVGGNINFNATIVNGTEENKEVTIVLVVYENGRIKSVTSKAHTIYAGGTSTVGTNGAVMPQNNPSAKAYVLDSWSTRVPVSNKIYKYN